MIDAAVHCHWGADEWTMSGRCNQVVFQARTVRTHAVRWTVVARIVAVGNVSVVGESDFRGDMHVGVVAGVALIVRNLYGAGEWNAGVTVAENVYRHSSRCTLGAGVLRIISIGILQLAGI